jgi:ketosteroid isomerase-like protein
VSNLAFDVTYIKQDGNFAWDVGTYRVKVPLNDGTKKEDRGKYLTIWKRVHAKWLIAADALPASA